MTANFHKHFECMCLKGFSSGLRYKKYLVKLDRSSTQLKLH